VRCAAEVVRGPVTEMECDCGTRPSRTNTLCNQHQNAPSARQAGTTEVAIDRLPGAPDGISRASDGNYWVAVLSPVPPIAKLLGEPGVRGVFAWMPDWARPAIKPWGTVIKVPGWGLGCAGGGVK